MRLFGQLQPARNVAGIVAQKNADGVFLLRDLPLEVGNLRRRGVYQLLRLAHIQHRVDSVLLERLRKLQRVLCVTQRALRDFQFEIQLAKLKI